MSTCKSSMALITILFLLHSAFSLAVAAGGPEDLGAGQEATSTAATDTTTEIPTMGQVTVVGVAEETLSGQL